MERSKKIETHQRAQKERQSTTELVRASYLQIKDSEAIADLFKKCREFAAYHTQVAKDGVGYKMVDDTQEIVQLTPEKRLSELDKAAGIEEIIGYLERQVTPVSQTAGNTTQKRTDQAN